jgi:transposase
LSEEEMNKVKKKIKAQPDVTLRELIEEYDLKISEPGLCKKLKKLNLSFKKRLLILQRKIDQMS